MSDLVKWDYDYEKTLQSVKLYVRVRCVCVCVLIRRGDRSHFCSNSTASPSDKRMGHPHGDLVSWQCLLQKGPAFLPMLLGLAICLLWSMECKRISFFWTEALKCHWMLPGKRHVPHRDCAISLDPGVKNVGQTGGYHIKSPNHKPSLL